jgi:hypothetical protein
MYHKHTNDYNEDVTIRVAAPREWDAIDRLAQRDSAPPPPRDAMLVAEVEGEMRAAVSVRNGYAIADPFRRSGEHVALLRARAEQLRGEAYRSPRAWRTIGLRLARASSRRRTGVV